MKQVNSHWLKWISELQAIAQNGLTYTKNDFDKERYLRLRELASEMMAYSNQKTMEQITEIFSLEKGYATPKMDVRAFILKSNKLLLVKERSDNLWSLPGGWIDVNESPSESVTRETKEETGYDVSVVKLLAFWDKQKHDHPPQWPHTYKCFFYCEILSGEPTINLEISEIDFFDLNNLPALSTHRVTQKQIKTLYKSIFASDKTLFD